MSSPLKQKRLFEDVGTVGSRYIKRVKHENDLGASSNSTSEASDVFNNLTGGLNFQPGAVVRVKMVNFVTYKEIEYHLGDSLNMIIGPNGSGKSTFVCALCLGLCGKPELLGRSTKLSDFVKIGCEEATIEIELKKLPQDAKNFIVKRTINKNGNSQWFIRKERTTLGNVQQHLARYKMQIDNLCQFLPQDKVASFSQSTPQELLINTERAIGSDEMVKQHEQLKVLAEELQNTSAGTSSDEAKLERLREEHRHDLAVIEEIRNYEQSKDLLVKSKKVLKLSELGDIEKELVKCESEVASASDNVERQRQSFLPLNERIKSSSDNYAKYLEEFHEVSGKIAGLPSTIEHDTEEIRDTISETQLHIRQYKEIMNRRKRHEQLINQCKETISRAEDELAAALDQKPDEPHNFSELPDLIKGWTEKIQELEEQVQELTQRKNVSDRMLQRLRVQLDGSTNRKKKMHSGSQQRYNMLAEFDSSSARAAELVRRTVKEHGNSYFERPVVTPAVLNLEITDKSCTQYVNSVLRKVHISSFVTQSYNDYRKLSDLLLNNNTRSYDTRVTIFNYPPEQSKEVEVPFPRDQLKQLGFDGYLLDIVKGPAALISMLCSEANINSIPYSKKRLSDSQKQRINTLKTPDGRFLFKTYIDCDTSVTVTFSRFGRKESTSRYQRLKPARRVIDIMAGYQVSKEDQAKIDTEIKGIESSILQEQRKIDELNMELSELNKTKGEYLDERTTLRNLRDTMNSWKTRVQKKRADVARGEEKLELLQQQAPEDEEKINELRSNYQTALESIIQLAERQQQATEKFKKLLTRKVHLDYARVRTKTEERTLNSFINRSIEEARRDLLIAEERLKMAKLKHRGVKREIRHAIDANELPILEAYLKETYPSEDATAEIRNKCAQLEAELHVTGEIHRDSERIMRQYEKRAEMIAELEQTISAANSNREMLKNRVAEIQRDWEPKLDDMIANVSHAFSEAFAAIHCKGEVALDKPYNNDIPQFKEWAIHIRVSFREEAPLQQLTAQRQSGGERAVSTVLYLMALQHQALAPFRVVDEINQGMDPANERMVHNRMVEVACKENTSQYFLVTPKLLPNLEYDKKMKVLCIFSGKHVKYKGGVRTTTKRVLDIMRERKKHSEDS